MTVAKFAKAVNLSDSTIRYRIKVRKSKPAMYTDSGYMMFSKNQIEE